jgi:hypothetical protein
MTDPNSIAATSAPARRPFDVLGLIGVIVGGLGVLPALLVFVIGLVPEMNAIWWLGIVLIPLLGITGLIALVLGVIGVVVGVRRRGRYVMSIVAIVLGVVSAAPISLLWITSFA